MAGRGPVGVRVTGLKTMARDARKTQIRLDRGIKKANRKSVQRALVPRVKARAPKRSGRLEGSVRGRATASRAQIIVGSNVRVPYAGPINFGWFARNIQPQEFIYSGIVAGNDDMLEIYTEEINKAVAVFAPLGKL